MNSRQISLNSNVVQIASEYDYPNPNIFLVTQVSRIKRTDRWLISMRLEELGISTNCRTDGSLWVEIDNGLQAILMRGVVQQMLASRQEQIDWLDRCWDSCM
jgi:hypothetical protein